MAGEVHQFTATIPANTPITAPYSAPFVLGLYDIESVDIEVPPGPSGLMGFYLAVGGQQWIPYEAGEWIVWDDRFDSWLLSDQPQAVGWSVVGYNLDDYPHDVVVRFHVNALSISSAVTPPVINIIQGAPNAAPVTL
jgi:hypothetical protein